MSVYGYLVCEDCSIKLWLGKAVRPDEHVKVSYFQNLARRWQDSDLDRVIGKFFSDHAGHTLRVKLEHELGDKYCGTIGGDGPGDISFEEYLRGWPG